MRFLALACLICCFSFKAHAQLGQFDNLLLDGGSSTGVPFIAMDNATRTHLISGFQDRLRFFVNNSYKFAIVDTAPEDALVLDAGGTKIKNQLQITAPNEPSSTVITFAREAANEEFYIRTYGPSVINGGGISIENQGGVPFLIFANAFARALAIREQGVGIGTINATAPLHVYAGSDPSDPYQEAKIMVENTSDPPTVRDMFELVNNGGSRFSFTDTNIGSRWEFSSNGGGSFSISQAGTGGPEMRITPNGRVTMGPGGANNFDLRPNGNLIIQGTLVQSSDRNKKKSFKEVNEKEVLEKLSRLPVYTWQFKHDDPEVRHMGPTAQDFRVAFRLGQDDKTIAPIDTVGVSLAGIKALNSELESKQDRVKQLNASVGDLREQAKQDRVHWQRCMKELNDKIEVQRETLDQQQKLLDAQEELLKSALGRLNAPESKTN